jgi:hypothetical protein
VGPGWWGRVGGHFEGMVTQVTTATPARLR